MILYNKGGIMKKILTGIILISSLGFSTASMATCPDPETLFITNLSDFTDDCITLSNRKFTGRPSSTAVKFFRMGARAYEKNDLERAEKAFNSALRAHSRELIPDIVLYLAKISEKNEELDKAFLYAFVYHQLVQPTKPIEDTLEDPFLEFTK